MIPCKVASVEHHDKQLHPTLRPDYLTPLIRVMQGILVSIRVGRLIAASKMGQRACRSLRGANYSTAKQLNQWWNATGARNRDSVYGDKTQLSDSCRRLFRCFTAQAEQIDEGEDATRVSHCHRDSRVALC
jgi:hypothetical protein